MEQKFESSGQTQNAQKKEWYKNGWGIVIAVLFFPYFLLWYMWAKTNWNKKVKWVITAIFVVINISALAGNSSDQPTVKNNEPTKVEQTQTTSSPAPAPQVPQFTFDVPSLIGKNIDEVKEILGKPSIDQEPTKQQITSGVADEWEKEFEKDSQSLLVTYHPKTKVIVDFFISGADKKALLDTGKLKENDSNYVIEFVKEIKNPSNITGVKISKKLPEELNANVTYSSNAFKIENKEDYDWSGCKFEINGGGKIFSGGYEYKSSTGIKAKDNIIIPFSEFTKDSQRFNFYSEKPENLFISCDTNRQSRTNYFTIN